MHHSESLPATTRRSARCLVALALVASLITGCGGEQAPASTGRGLVLLPDETPLARGVEARDPRPNFHDFGRVPDGDTVTHVFRMPNEDPRDVSVTAVDPGCGCTVASLRAETRLSVAPGERV